jgi:COMPASS component SPP1
MDRGQTTWKAMCRLDECNKPARVTGKNVSKFCSDEHGREFMAQSLRRSGIAVATDGPSPAKKRRKSNWTDHDSNEDSEYNGEDKNDKDYEDEEESRGGVLKAGELKAAVNSVKSAEEFRKLGEGVLSRAQPKNNTLENGINGNVTSSASIKDEDIALTKPEHKTLKDIELSRTLLSDRRARLADREKFLSAVRHRGKAALEHLKAKDKSFKDICGFDPRLSWSDDHFDAFRSSAEGVKVLVRDEALGGPATTKWVESGVDAMNIDPALDNPNVNPKATGNANAGANVTTTDPETDGACLAKRCVQHTQWIRIFGDGIREEVRLLKAEEAAMDREEKGVKQRAMLRMLEGKN